MRPAGSSESVVQAPDAEHHDLAPAARAALIEDLRTLALISLGNAETWTGRLDQAESHLEQAVALAQPPLEPLSSSEIRLLRYLPTHLSAPEIAAELSVSTSTVKTHLRNLYAKHGVHRRAQAVARARALGLLAPSAHQRGGAGEGRFHAIPGGRHRRGIRRDRHGDRARAGGHRGLRGPGPGR